MNRNRSFREIAAHELPALCTLLLFIFLRFLPGIWQGLLYAPFRDNVFIYGPMFSETARIALHGEYPFYLPSFATGFQLYQSPHYSPSYPFYFFGLLDYGGPLRSLYTLTYLTIFHRAILALNCYVMLRCALAGPLASFMGAALVVFAYNSEVYAAWITITASYTWMPLLIAGSILLLRNPRRIAGAVLLGLSAGLLALASASQAIAHAVLFAVLFFGTGSVWLFRKQGVRAILQLATSLALAGLLAFGIGAVSAVPAYLGVGEMIRHIGHAYVLGHEHIPWSRFNETQLSLKDWSAIFVNPGKVEVVGSPYIGPFGLAGLAFICIFFRKLDPFQRFLGVVFAVLGIYGIASAFGTHLGLSYLNFHLPLIDSIREAGRHLVLFLIAAVLLSGLGFNCLFHYLQHIRLTHCWRSWQLRAVIAVLLISLALAIWELSMRVPLAAMSVVLLLAPLTWLVAFKLKSRTLYSLVLPALAVSIASVISPARMFPLAASEYVQDNNVQNLATLATLQQRLQLADDRIDFVDSKTSPFTWGMNASYFGFKSFYNRITPQPYKQFRVSAGVWPARLREMLGARYVLCRAGERPPDSRAIAKFAIQDFVLYENPTYMRRLTVAHALAGGYSKESQVILALTRGFDFQNSVFLPQQDLDRVTPFLSPKGQVPQSSQTEHVTIGGESTNRISINLELSRPGVLILNDWFTPAWKAHINGVASAPIPANNWQVGLPVPAGKSVVEFTYRPNIAFALLIVNRVTWVLLAVFCLVGFFRRRVASEKTVASLSIDRC